MHKILMLLDLIFLGDWWSGSKVYIYIDKQDMDTYIGKEHIFGVAGHVELDWLMVIMLADRIGLQGVRQMFASLTIYKQHLVRISGLI